jgi:hypothetical protein
MRLSVKDKLAWIGEASSKGFPAAIVAARRLKRHDIASWLSKKQKEHDQARRQSAKAKRPVAGSTRLHASDATPTAHATPAAGIRGARDVASDVHLDAYQSVAGQHVAPSATRSHRPVTHTSVHASTLPRGHVRFADEVLSLGTEGTDMAGGHVTSQQAADPSDSSDSHTAESEPDPEQQAAADAEDEHMHDVHSSSQDEQQQDAAAAMPTAAGDPAAAVTMLQQAIAAATALLQPLQTQQPTTGPASRLQQQGAALVQCEPLAGVPVVSISQSPEAVAMRLSHSEATQLKESYLNRSARFSPFQCQVAEWLIEQQRLHDAVAAGGPAGTQQQQQQQTQQQADDAAALTDEELAAAQQAESYEATLGEVTTMIQAGISPPPELVTRGLEAVVGYAELLRCHEGTQAGVAPRSGTLSPGLAARLGANTAGVGPRSGLAAAAVPVGVPSAGVSPGENAHGAGSTNAHLKHIKQPAAFSGAKGDEPIRKWLTSMAHFLTITKVPTSEGVGVAVSYLRSVAQSYWFGCQHNIISRREDPTNWDVFRAWMVRGFGATDPELGARYQIERLPQTGTVEEYARELQTLFAELVAEPMDERSQVLKFHTGLKPAISAQVQVDPVTKQPWATLPEAIEYAIRHENAYLTTVQRRAAANPSNPPSGAFRRVGKKHGKGWRPFHDPQQRRQQLLSGDFKGKGKGKRQDGWQQQGRRNRGNGGTGGGSNGAGTSAAAEAAGVAERQRRFHAGLCLACGSADHIKVNCPHAKHDKKK